jgi:hypothetical protein
MKDVVASDRLHAEFGQDTLGGVVSRVDDGQNSFGSAGQRPGKAG